MTEDVRAMYCLGRHSLSLDQVRHHPQVRNLIAQCQPGNGDQAAADIVLVDTGSTVECWWQKNGQKGRQKPLKLAVEFDKYFQSIRSFPAPKQGAFNQAIGRKTGRVIDASGGWGGDAFLLCSQGYQVTVLERHPILAFLLADAVERLASSKWGTSTPLHVPDVQAVDARYYFAQSRACPDTCVYFDPMFPTKKKISAAVNKRMQFLQAIIDIDEDANQVVDAALRYGASRVVIKRPHYAAPLVGDPQLQFSSKLVHYDVYLGGT